MAIFEFAVFRDLFALKRSAYENVLSWKVLPMQGQR